MPQQSILETNSLYIRHMDFEEKRQIMDRFGQLLVKEAYDHPRTGLKQIISGEAKAFPRLAPFCEQFEKLDTQEKEVFEELIAQYIEESLFNFLRMIEENEEYSLTYKNSKGELFNLSEISENLFAELPGQLGWISKFSRFHQSQKD